MQLTASLTAALQHVNEKLFTVIIVRLPTLNVLLSLIILTGQSYAFTAVVAIYHKILYVIEWLYSPHFSGKNVFPYADIYVQLISDSCHHILSHTKTDIHVLYLTYRKT